MRARSVHGTCAKPPPMMDAAKQFLEPMAGERCRKTTMESVLLPSDWLMSLVDAAGFLASLSEMQSRSFMRGTCVLPVAPDSVAK